MSNKSRKKRSLLRDEKIYIIVIIPVLYSQLYDRNVSIKKGAARLLIFDRTTNTTKNRSTRR